MSGNCYYCGSHPDEVVDLRRRRDELEAEMAATIPALVKALEVIVNHKPTMSDFPDGVEGYKMIAREALAAYRKDS